MFIQTKRLELKPITHDSLEALAELLADDVVKQTYMVPDFASKEEAIAMAQRLMALSEDEDRHLAGIYLGPQLIGMLNETDRQDDRVEVGYALLPRFYNQGYATEALTGAIPYFFAQGFREVIAGAFEENAASFRVMVKSGMNSIPYEDEVAYRGKTHRCRYCSIQQQ